MEAGDAVGLNQFRLVVREGRKNEDCEGKPDSDDDAGQDAEATTPARVAAIGVDHQLRTRMRLDPWNNPQSIRIRCPPESTRSRDPVKVSAAPPRKRAPAIRVIGPLWQLGRC